MNALDRYLADDDHFEELQLWLKTPAHKHGNLMPKHLAEKLERLHLIYQWLQVHGSKRHVWPMILAHCKMVGFKYSESTAKREVAQAQEFFSTITRATGRFYTEFMLDRLIERAEAAARAGKDKEYAMLALAVDRFIERADRYAAQDEEMMHQPVPIRAVFDPKEAGITPDPDIHLKVQEWKAKRAARLKLPSNIPDADFTETDASH